MDGPGSGGGDCSGGGGGSGGGGNDGQPPSPQSSSSIPKKKNKKGKKKQGHTAGKADRLPSKVAAQQREQAAAQWKVQRTLVEACCRGDEASVREARARPGPASQDSPQQAPLVFGEVPLPVKVAGGRAVHPLLDPVQVRARL